MEFYKKLINQTYYGVLILIIMEDTHGVSKDSLSV